MKSKFFAILLLSVVVAMGACGSDEEETKSSDKAITTFTIDGDNWTINQSALTIRKEFPKGTEVGNLTPTLIVHTGVSVSPAQGVSQDFSDEKEVEYKVTAEDGSIATYKARATVAQ